MEASETSPTRPARSNKLLDKTPSKAKKCITIRSSGFACGERTACASPEHVWPNPHLTRNLAEIAKWVFTSNNIAKN